MISLTFDGAFCSDHCRQSILRKKRLIRSEKAKWILLTLNPRHCSDNCPGSIKKMKKSIGEIAVNFSHFWSASLLMSSYMLDLGNAKISFGETEVNFIYLRSLSTYVRMIFQDRSGEGKNSSGEREVKSTYLWSTRLFRSLSKINLENKEIPSADREVNANHFRSTTVFWSLSRLDLENKQRFICTERMDLNTLSIEMRLQIIVEDWSRKGKNSFAGTTVKSTLFFRGVFESLSTSDRKEEKICLKKERKVDFTHFRTRRLFVLLSTIDLKQGEIDLEKEREVNLAVSRWTLPVWTVRLIEWYWKLDLVDDRCGVYAAKMNCSSP